jgi:hypothetical protein
MGLDGGRGFLFVLVADSLERVLPELVGLSPVTISLLRDLLTSLRVVRL